jgi:hypothetical protein
MSAQTPRTAADLPEAGATIREALGSALVCSACGAGSMDALSAFDFLLAYIKQLEEQINDSGSTPGTERPTSPSALHAEVDQVLRELWDARNALDGAEGAPRLERT